MKRIILLLCALFLSCLVGCSNGREISGKITEINTDDNIELISFVIQTDDGEDVGIFLTDETRIFALAKGITTDEFKKGSFTDVIVCVEHENSKHSLHTEDNQDIIAYNANCIEISGFLTEESMVLSDKTAIDIWNYSHASAFSLPNGIELLRVQYPTGPNNVYVGGVKSFDDLSEDAQKNVMEYYSEQGLLYDLQFELEKAYADYLQKENNSNFNSYMLNQDISPTASNEDVMYFLTTVLFPIDSDHGYEYRIGTAFDRKTGEVISNDKLFSCSSEETIQTIMDIAGITDLDLRREIEHAFNPENIIIFPDCLELSFPQGTLPSQENTYILGIDYDDSLCKIFYSWAIPQNKS